MVLFNSEVAHVDSLFKANYLSLNPSKSNYAIVHRDRKLLPSIRSGLTIGGQEVVRVTVVRFLGVLLDKCLKFSNHANSFACKVSRYTSIAYKLRRYLNLDSLKLMYLTMIYRNITCYISDWGASSASVVIPLLIGQKTVMGRP